MSIDMKTMTEQIRIHVTPEAKTKLLKDCEETGYTNYSMYIRDLLSKKVKPLANKKILGNVYREMNAQGKNLNQVARHMNSTVLFGEEVLDEIVKIRKAHEEILHEIRKNNLC
jgi:hypothetical protein